MNSTRITAIRVRRDELLGGGLAGFEFGDAVSQRVNFTSLKEYDDARKRDQGDGDQSWNDVGHGNESLDFLRSSSRPSLRPSM